MESRKYTDESRRMEDERQGKSPWRKWGPYLSERQWGTVREDYSQNGDAWDYFSHDQARSRAYHWGEDGIAGISDDKQLLCFALALWNGKDPIIKERLFGITNSEGNHGEDVKEYYFYLDSTPTHSYMKYLYKYPQLPFPYTDLAHTNQARSRYEFEYELLDTGIFQDDRYFDVFIEYAKASSEDILIRVTVFNRGPESSLLHLLPTVWFRNTWSWGEDVDKPFLKQIETSHEFGAIEAVHALMGNRYFYIESDVPLLFTENETNNERLFGTPNASPFVKDGINNYITQGLREAVNPMRTGTKAAAHHVIEIGPGQSATIRLRLSNSHPDELHNPFGTEFDDVFGDRAREADDFYRSVTPPEAGEEEAGVMRQALAGMFWTKQYYNFAGDKWLVEHSAHPLFSPVRDIRNREWFHMVNEHVISMPDKWEYPWYAAWDLAFHTIALAYTDVDFAKNQLDLLLRETYLHPNGQIPAYEWNFSDVNPPVHAWAAYFIYKIEEGTRGNGDIEFLKRAFNKLMLNFTWWVNRKDRFGKNVFEGGFLGLDNIGVFDRSAPLPTGGYLEQADGTAWMAFFCQNMFSIAIELAAYDPAFSDLAIKFAEHFLWIAAATNRLGEDGMWDEEDGFYYDLLRFPDGGSTRLKVRSMVGLLPLCATTIIEKYQRERNPRVTESLYNRLLRMPELLKSIHVTGPGNLGMAERGIAALVNEQRLPRILARLLDENEFLSPYGIRALSRYHLEHPYTFYVHGEEHKVEYLPAESNSGMFGGNSNWRGPIWYPVNVLIIRGLMNYFLYYGDNLKVECPTGSGNFMNLYEVSREIAQRLTRIFTRDERGRRPVYGGIEKFQNDPHWRDHVLFYEYFHGDNGAGLGASHQTGWTGLIAALIQSFGYADPQKMLEEGAFSSLKEAA